MKSQLEYHVLEHEAALAMADPVYANCLINKHISATQDLQKQSDHLDPATDHLIIASPSTSHSHGRHFTESISPTSHVSLELEYSQVDANIDDIVEPTARDFWSHEETLALIQWYIANQENFETSKNKKKMWELMSDELSSMGIIKKPKACENKWKNLLRSYKIVKDNAGKMGREGGGCTRFAYYNIMDEFLGNKQSTSCNHAISVGAKASNTFEDRVESAKTPEPLQDTDDLESNDNDNKSKKNKRINHFQELIKLKKEFLLKKKKNQDKIDKEKERKELREERKLQLLSRKLDIEERKASALEEYLKSKK